MQTLLPLAEKIGAMLKDRRETIAIAESTTGGLVSAALLSIAGASVFYIGGAVVYTLKARALLDIPDSAFSGLKPLTEPFSMVIARGARDRFGSTWSMGELGAAGPTGSRYGEPAGTSVIAVAGPVERSLTVHTGSGDRQANMRAFSLAALDLIAQAIAAAPRA
ncbi:MAG TPA: CinA family protein [Candidatus Binataceae bacterium]|jgi:PncC family amidohydrolase|nr:CinA family protein [Candidatus Binataceae bacterium]